MPGQGRNQRRLRLAMPRGMEDIFWTFSLALYRQEQVKEACLALQDSSSLDVNLLLYCCWAGQGGHLLSHNELRRLHGLSANWQTGILRPMRQVRQRLAKEEGAESVYQAAKSFELQLERVEQSRLLAEVPVRWGKGGRETASANLRTYLMLAAVVRDQAVNRYLDRLLEAMDALSGSAT